MLQSWGDAARRTGTSELLGAVHEAIASGAACSYENEIHAESGGAVVRYDSRVRARAVHRLWHGSHDARHPPARAFTGRTKILKIEGHFHGYHDQVMFAIGSPPDRLSEASGLARVVGNAA